MIPTLPPNNSDILPTLTDDGYPCFVNTADDSPDEPADWWLDLGRVDLPELTGV